MHRLIIVLMLAMLLSTGVAKAQEITDPNLPVVRCAGVSCTDPLYFFEYRVFLPMIGGNQ